MDEKVIIEFCELCNSAYGAWIFHRAMFEDNPNVQEFDSPRSIYIMKRLLKMSHEYLLLQIIKLHDPARQAGNTNLSIDYMTKNLDWDNHTRSRLQTLKSQLDELLKEPLSSARCKILCHNDLQVILNEEIQGKIDIDNDKKYFDKLQEFVDVVHDSSVGGIYPFSDLPENDAYDLLSIMRKGLSAKPIS